MGMLVGRYRGDRRDTDYRPAVVHRMTQSGAPTGITDRESLGQRDFVIMPNW